MQVRNKSEWRQWVLSERRALDSGTRAAEDQALAELATTAVPTGSTVCAYVPTALEPGSLNLLDALRQVATRVLVPITHDSGPLQWSEYTGTEGLSAARFGLREPTGVTLDPAAIASADTVLVPALAVDHHGVRLGRGAGFYDRSLVLAKATARLIAVVRDEELVDQLPEDPHDVRMGWALTPGSGLVQLGGIEP